jgi:hypothetical protein
MPFRLADFLPDWVAAHPRLMTSLVIVAPLATLVTWQQGGFHEVPPAPLPTYAANATIVTNEWTLRPERAWLGERDPTGRRAPPGGAILVLELIAENRTNRSSGSVTQALRLLAADENVNDDSSGGATSMPSLVLLRDPSLGAIVHPGLPERIAATWDWTPPVSTATEARFRVIGREWVERDSLIGGSGWLRGRTVGELVLPIEDRRPAGVGGAP